MRNTLHARLGRGSVSRPNGIALAILLFGSLGACTKAEEPVTENRHNLKDGAAWSSSADGSDSPSKDGADGTNCTACDGACEEEVAIGPATHVSGDIEYTDIPPAGGSHGPCWVDWGVHTSPVPPENWVHNLEHGGVVFLYSCPSGCPDAIASLAAFVDGRQQALLTSYPDMPAGFAVVSWGYRLVSTCLDMNAMQRFYEEHVANAPENVPGGAGCLR